MIYLRLSADIPRDHLSPHRSPCPDFHFTEWKLRPRRALACPRSHCPTGAGLVWTPRRQLWALGAGWKLQPRHRPALEAALSPGTARPTGEGSRLFSAASAAQGSSDHDLRGWPRLAHLSQTAVTPPARLGLRLSGS